MSVMGYLFKRNARLDQTFYFAMIVQEFSISVTVGIFVR